MKVVESDYQTGTKNRPSPDKTTLGGLTVSLHSSDISGERG